VKKYRCKLCGYIYDPEKGDPDSGIEPGTPFEELPDDWVCPLRQRKGRLALPFLFPHDPAGSGGIRKENDNSRYNNTIK